jgi:hypothetical protein
MCMKEETVGFVVIVAGTESVANDVARMSAVDCRRHPCVVMIVHSSRDAGVLPHLPCSVTNFLQTLKGFVRRSCRRTNRVGLARQQAWAGPHTMEISARTSGELSRGLAAGYLPDT